jgi:AraC family transcriptional regulator
MSDYNILSTSPLAYFYVEKTTSMDQNDIGAAMGAGFQAVYGHMMANGVTPSGEALAVYLTPPGETMTYHVGFSVSAQDLSKAGDGISGASIPAQKALMHTHMGPYSGLGAAYQRIMAHLADNGLECVGPSWEIYKNDPSTVSEDEIQTDIYMPVG